MSLTTSMSYLSPSASKICWWCLWETASRTLVLEIKLVKEQDQRKITILRQPIHLRIFIGDSTPGTRSPKPKRFSDPENPQNPDFFSNGHADRGKQRLRKQRLTAATELAWAHLHIHDLRRLLAVVWNLHHDERFLPLQRS
nr:receptor protein kinase-like protein ZAR1 [Ipomoea trifida]